MPQSALGLDVAEDEPLLDSADRAEESDDSAIASQVPLRRARSSLSLNSLSPARWQVSSPRRVIVLLSFIKFSVVASGMLLLVPYARLIEDLFCHDYYRDGSSGIIDEMKCKVDEIQSHMAFLTGWTALATAVIGLIVAFPYGIMADKIGRKPTVIFAYLGLAVSFGAGPVMLRGFQQYTRKHPYILLMGALFQVLGGGIPVLLSTLYAMAADVSTEQEKASNFLYLTFGSTAGGLLGPVVAGILMKQFSPWLPIFIVLGTIPFVLVILLLLPETLKVDIKAQRSEAQEPALVSLKDYVAHGFKELRHALGMLRNRSVLLILVTFFVQNARFTAYTSLLAQYVSKHFGWKLAETSLLLAPIGLLNLVVLALLPKVSGILLSPRFRMTPFGKDLALTRVSTSILVIGAVLQGLSHNVVLFLFGLFISTFGAAG